MPKREPAPGRRSPTLDVVAGKAGVSRATASRALNGAPNVSADTRRAVLDAAASLDYIPNRAARSLVTRRSDTVAFVVRESGDRFFDDPFFSRILRGAHGLLAEHGKQLVFVVNSDETDTRRFLNFASGGHVDGAVVISAHGKDSLPCDLLALGVPVVLNGRPLAEASGLHYVDADNRGGARAATTWLVQRGCRSIGTVTGPQDMAAGRDRLAGYREAIRAVGEKPNPKAIAEGDFSVAGGFEGMRRLLKLVPDLDGVFVGNDLMSVGAMQAVESVGRRVPEDIAVVGFDDIPIASMTQPPLTTIRQPIEAMGRQMAAMLLDLLRGRSVPQSLVLPTELVRRGSA